MLTLISALTLSLTLCSSHEIVTTQLGKIRGHYKISFENRWFLAFEGIPYAKPPVGARRFEAPEPIEKWEGVWDATFLYQCVQVVPPTQNLNIVGDEDCLYLNVYVPRLRLNTSEKLDVIVHIHGGAFMFGNGHSYAFPGYLMDHDVVFVTFNYRLGIFGFLSTEDEVLPGNNGLKDQVLALEWVKNHIEEFGGNPDSVTLTGASAGGASVHLHYFSSLSRGLFQRGLSQSGSALNPWALQKGASDKAKKLGSALGCLPETSEILKRCLKERTYWQILSQIHLFFEFKEFLSCPFAPVVEKGSQPFLSEEPHKLLKQGRVQNLPWIASFVPQEANSLVSDLQRDIDKLNSKWKDYAPFLLDYNYTVSKKLWENVAKKIQEFYLGKNQKFTKNNFKKVVELVSDRMFIDGIFKSVDLQAKATNASVYLYELSYTGNRKNFVDHADDNQYFFYNATGTRTQDDVNMKSLMVEMLVTYAKFGKPEVDGVVWKPVKCDQINFLNISGFKTEDINLHTNTTGNGDFWRFLNLDI